MHGTICKQPIELFYAEEAGASLPLPARQVASRTRRLKRNVANDCSVDIDTVRYSVPYRLVENFVVLEVGGDIHVRIYAAEICIATHDRC